MGLECIAPTIRLLLFQGCSILLNSAVPSLVEGIRWERKKYLSLTGFSMLLPTFHPFLVCSATVSVLHRGYSALPTSTLSSLSSPYRSQKLRMPLSSLPSHLYLKLSHSYFLLTDLAKWCIPLPSQGNVYPCTLSVLSCFIQNLKPSITFPVPYPPPAVPTSPPSPT